MTYRNNRSLFTSYLMSYSGIVVLSCAIISLIFINLYINDLQSQQKQSIKEKATLALNDIQRQFDSLYNTSLKISIQKIYWPSYFKFNKYNEIELLDDFVRYQNHFLICNEYFLSYHGSNIVFHSAGSTRAFSNYMQSLGIPDTTDLLNRFNACEAFEMMVFDALDMSFVLYPVNTVDDTKAILCFVIYGTDFRSRVQATTGGFKDNYSLYYKTNVLLHDKIPETDDEGTRLLEAYSENGNWHMTINYSQSMQELSLFRTFNILLLVCSVLLLLTFAAYAAYKNYKPIKRVASQYSLQPLNKSASQSKNELLEIDSLFRQYLENASLNKVCLKNQQILIRQQMLRLLVNGEFRKEMESQLSSIELSLPGPYYCVFVVALQAGNAALPAKDSPGDINMRDVLKLIEDLSDEEILLYPMDDNSNRQIVVLLSLSEEWQKEDAAQMVKELFAVKGYPFVFGAGNVYDTMLRFPASYLDALFDSKYGGSSIPSLSVETKAAAFNDPLNYDMVTVNHMLHDVKQGNLEPAQQHLTHFIAELDKKEVSYLFLRYIFVDILRRLAAIGRQIQRPVSERQISLIVTANNTAAFYEGVSLIINDLCAKVRSDFDRINNDTAFRIICYMKENCSDYNLTIEKISMDLNIGINRISQLIKQETGKSYKDYIIYLRINLAKELLLNSDLTVAEICMQVGYSNISHFIKTFKTQVQTTPGMFRKKQ